MLLVTGCNGQLGTALQTLLHRKAIYADKDTLDLTDESAVKAFVEKNKVDTVINTAAFTAVDKAQQDEGKAMAYFVNVMAPLYLSKYVKNVIHISTDYVFDGRRSMPYTEKEMTNPLSIYGTTKRDGEQAVLETAETATIIRTAWLYSPHGNNFVKTMRKLGAERPSINVVNDQIGTPTYAYDLASAIVTMLPQIKKGEKEIYHYTNEGVCSWYDFATEIMEQSGLKCIVNPIESKDYYTPAPRPYYSVLNKSKIKSRFGITIPHWKEGLKRCIRQF